MKTAIEYELAKRMRSATRWVEGQQGMLPPEEQFVPPIGYGGGGGGSGLKLILVGEIVGSRGYVAHGKIINSTNLDLGGTLDLPAPDTYGQNVFVMTLDQKPPLMGSRVLAWLSGTLSAAQGMPAGEYPLYVVQQKAISANAVTIIPVGMRRIYLVDLVTGDLRTDTGVDFVLWSDEPYLYGDGGTGFGGSNYTLYLPEGVFQQGAGGSEEGQSYPKFLYSYDVTGIDGTKRGTKASWAGTLAGKIWNSIVYNKPVGLSIRNASLLALPTNFLGVLSGTSLIFELQLSKKFKWVMPYISDGKTYLQDVNIIKFLDTQLALRDMGLLFMYAYACTYEGTKITGGAIPSYYCMSQDGWNGNAKLIYYANGLVNTLDSALCAFVEGKLNVVQVKHNKAPNYVAPAIAPSTTLGAPLGAPLGG